MNPKTPERSSVTSAPIDINAPMVTTAHVAWNAPDGDRGCEAVPLDGERTITPEELVRRAKAKRNAKN